MNNELFLCAIEPAWIEKTVNLQANSIDAMDIEEIQTMEIA